MRYLLIPFAACWLCYAQNPVTDANATRNLPVQPVGINDLLLVSVYGSPELSRSVRVNADGKVRLPMLKNGLEANGLLPSALEESIAKALVVDGLLVDPLVTVSIAEYHSRPVSVAGAVRNSITFQAETPMTLLEAIARAGGIEKTAGDEILVTRERTTLRIPVKGLMSGASDRWNITLRGGEQIRIPEAGRIFVVGSVRKPGAFSAAELEDASVMKAVAMAEGLAPFSGRQAFIYRPDGKGGRQEISVNLNQIMKRKSADVELQPYDVLYIPDNKNGKLAAVALERLLLFGSTAGATALIYGR